MFTLLTTLFNETKKERQDEYIQCIDMNISDPFISRIIVFYEKKDDSDYMLSILKDRKVDIVYIDKRPTYEDFFIYSNIHNLTYSKRFWLFGKILCHNLLIFSE